jgi:Phage gp6-like head-tail connector protein
MNTPNAKLVRLSDASVEPITLDDAKNYLRVEITDDDALISSLITAARMDCENEVDRSFVTTSWRLTMDYFPNRSWLWPILPYPLGIGLAGDRNYWLDLTQNAIRFPYPPLISVTNCTYVDQSGKLQNLDLSSGAQLVSIGNGTPGQMAPYPGKFFPLTLPSLGAVNIDFTAGYGPDGSFVPENIKMAIRFLVASYYRWRDETGEMPLMVQRLLNASSWGAYS